MLKSCAGTRFVGRGGGGWKENGKKELIRGEVKDVPRCGQVFFVPSLSPSLFLCEEEGRAEENGRNTEGIRLVRIRIDPRVCKQRAGMRWIHDARGKEH